MTDEEICHMYAATGSAESVAMRAGCSTTTVISICRKAGLPIQKPGGPPGRKPLRLSDAEVIRRYLGGESGASIAAAAGCGYSRIYQILERAGVERRDRITASRLARARQKGKPP
jgi:hypothetical protein